MSKNGKAGLEALLLPEDSIVVLIDHQPFQFTNLDSHDPSAMINAVAGFANILVEHGGTRGVAFAWEQQLLNTPVPAE
ncbi:Isochorismatase hydrolase [Pedobacter sp. BAL39]|uniref:hypothetical protein n=1 Tax=Pedobacter sp. BAL39 TaxID=391596 RepID=UPI000155AA20|nr:hypothetical protein [Pedobacter sp. BAL39]EDM34423.1 Isochorismatase hydrolase [Pedobacter sp. BAL39]